MSGCTVTRRAEAQHLISLVHSYTSPHFFCYASFEPSLSSSIYIQSVAIYIYASRSLFLFKNFSCFKMNKISAINFVCMLLLEFMGLFVISLPCIFLFPHLHHLIHITIITFSILELTWQNRTKMFTLRIYFCSNVIHTIAIQTFFLENPAYLLALMSLFTRCLQTYSLILPQNRHLHLL